jgi:hypothetical protein
MASSVRDLPFWCIVQADGDRLHLTSQGRVPIEYCHIQESLPPIQRSLHRALRITRPRQVVVTLAEVHRKWWLDPLWCVPPHRRVVDESSGRFHYNSPSSRSRFLVAAARAAAALRLRCG